MPLNLVIDRTLDFRNKTHQRNVVGPMQERKRHDWDRFTGITLDTTNRWATSVPGSGDTIAISEVQGGSVLITTGSGDNDSCMLASAIIYSGNKLAIVEWRITITDVSKIGLFVGLSDVKSHGNTSIAIHYPGDVLTTVATDAVGFVIDADHATSSIMCCGVKNNTDETSVDSGTDWADGETKVLRIELNGDEATFYLDGIAVGYLDDAVTAATLLCATVQAITRDGAASQTARVRSYDAWQDD